MNFFDSGGENDEVPSVAEEYHKHSAVSSRDCENLLSPRLRETGAESRKGNEEREDCGNYYTATALYFRA